MNELLLAVNVVGSCFAVMLIILNAVQPDWLGVLIAVAALCAFLLGGKQAWRGLE